MLKATLISLAVLAAVDFAAFQGHYRYQVAHAAVNVFHQVAGQNWHWL
jgi:hypothetical protein